MKIGLILNDRWSCLLCNTSGIDEDEKQCEIALVEHLKFFHDRDCRLMSREDSKMNEGMKKTIVSGPSWKKVG